MHRYIFLAIAVLSVSAFANAEEKSSITGIWQGSFAYLGKVPYFNGYLIITEDKVIEETEGKINYQFRYDLEVSGKDFYILNILDSEYKGMYARISLNPKFGCKPKSRLSYDKSCNSHHWDNVFSYCIYSTLENAKNNEDKCKTKDKYFTFTSSQKKSISKLSGSL